MYAAHRGRAGRRAGAAGRPQPHRPRRRHRHGADDGRRRAGRGRARPLGAPSRRHAEGRPRPVRCGAVATSLRGRPRVHPRDGRLGRRLGAQGRAHRAGHAPGHDRKRCVYVDFLNTGPAVSKTLRARVQPHRPRSAASATCWSPTSRCSDGVCVGAHAIARVDGRHRCRSRAKATIIATGGLTRLYARNSASINMGGDGYALGACAPAPSWSTWSSCSSFRSAISRRGWSAWIRSCGTRSATSSAAGCSTPNARSSSP